MVVSDGSRPYRAAINQYLPTPAMCWTGSMSRGGSPKGSPWYAENSGAAHPTRHPPHMSLICSAPGSPSYAAPITSPKPTA